MIHVIIIYIAFRAKLQARSAASEVVKF